MSITRRCGSCGGTVSHTTNTTELPGPNGTIQRVRGLGHWRCDRGCPKRKLTTNRIIASGKESERDSRTPTGWADEFVRSIPTLRDISVRTNVSR